MTTNGHQEPTEAEIHLIGATYFHVIHDGIICMEELASHSASLQYVCYECLIFAELWGHFKCHHLGFSSLSRNEEGPYDNDHHPSLYAK